MINPDELGGVTHSHVENASGDSNLFIGNYEDLDIVSSVLNSSEEYNYIKSLREENRELMNDVDRFTDQVLHVLDNDQYCGYRWVESRLNRAEKLVEKVEENIQEADLDDVDLLLYHEDVKEGAETYVKQVRKGIESIQREARRSYGQINVPNEANSQTASAD